MVNPHKQQKTKRKPKISGSTQQTTQRRKIPKKPKIRFDQIIRLVEEAMNAIEYQADQGLESVLAADLLARKHTEQRVNDVSQ